MIGPAKLEMDLLPETGRRHGVLSHDQRRDYRFYDPRIARDRSPTLPIPGGTVLRDDANYQVLSGRGPPLAVAERLVQILLDGDSLDPVDLHCLTSSLHSITLPNTMNVAFQATVLFERRRIA
jgi:hypothetical protein